MYFRQKEDDLLPQITFVHRLLHNLWGEANNYDWSAKFFFDDFRWCRRPSTSGRGRWRFGDPKAPSRSIKSARRTNTSRPTMTQIRWNLRPEAVSRNDANVVGMCGARSERKTEIFHLNGCLEWWLRNCKIKLLSFDCINLEKFLKDEPFPASFSLFLSFLLYNW